MGKRNKTKRIFFNIKDLLRSTELSQCDCKYHFYGIKLGIGSPDRFVSSLILPVSHCVCVWVCVGVGVCACGWVCGRMHAWTLECTTFMTCAAEYVCVYMHGHMCAGVSQRSSVESFS